MRKLYIFKSYNHIHIIKDYDKLIPQEAEIVLYPDNDLSYLTNIGYNLIEYYQERWGRNRLFRIRPYYENIIEGY